MHHLSITPRCLSLAVASLLLPLLTASVSAVSLYRCNRNGQVEFRQTPCEEGRQSTTQVIDRSGGMTPAKPALHWRSQPRRASRSAPKGEKRVPDERACWKMSQRLEKVDQQLRGGYRPVQYNGLHRKQERYEDYLRRFCR